MFKNDVDWALPFTLVITNFFLGKVKAIKKDRRAEARKRRREELEQETQNTLFGSDMDIGNDQEWDDNMSTTTCLLYLLIEIYIAITYIIRLFK